MRDNINYILVILFLFGGILPGSAVAYDCFKVGNGIYENQGKYYSGPYTMVDDMWLNEGTGVLEFSSHTIEAVTGTYYYHAGSFSVESWDSQNSIWVQTDSKLMSTNQRYLFSDTAKASLDSLMEQSNVHLPSENMETGCSDPDPQPPNPQSHGSQTYKCFKFSNGLYPNQNRYHDGPFTMVDDMWINYDTGKIEYSSYPIDADTDVYHWAAGSFSVQVWDKEELQWITSDSRLMSINEHFVFSTNAKESLENLEAQPEIFPPSEVLPTCSSSKYELDCRSGQGLCVPTCDSSVDLDSDGVSECADCDDSDPAIGADCISPIGPPEKCNDQGFQSNPISIYNGNKFEQVTDLNIPTPNRNGLRLTRYYNSRSSASSVLGHGWSHSFDHTLAINVPFNNSTYLQINHGGGKKYYFSDSGNNRWDGEFHEDSHVIAEDGGYTWYQLDGSTSHFASNGALEWTEDDFGNRQSLAYDQSGFLQTVTDNASGRALTFNYTNNLLTSVSGPASAVVTNGVLVTYSYDSNSNLESATSADGSGLTYEYTDPNDIHNLTAKKDKSGHLIASWGYDSLDRANQSFTRDGQGVTVNFRCAGRGL